MASQLKIGPSQKCNMRCMHADINQLLLPPIQPRTMEMCPATSDRITDLAAILAAHNNQIKITRVQHMANISAPVVFCGWAGVSFSLLLSSRRTLSYAPWLTCINAILWQQSNLWITKSTRTKWISKLQADGLPGRCCCDACSRQAWHFSADTYTNTCPLRTLQNHTHTIRRLVERENQMFE